MPTDIRSNVTAGSGLCRIEEVMRVCAVSRATVDRAIARGELPVFKFGRAVRIDRSDLEAWQRSKRTDARQRAA